MASIRQAMPDEGAARRWPRGRRIALSFYLGVPLLTAILFGLNQAGMARALPMGLAIPYWMGLTVPLWLLLDLCSRAFDWVTRSWSPHRWIVLLAGSIAAMAVFAPYVTLYADLFSGQLVPGQHYRPNVPPFPDAFVDLRRFASYSGVPIYWITVSLFFANFFGFPLYLVGKAPASPAAPGPAPTAPVRPVREAEPLNEYGLPVRQGFRALLPFHLGDELVSLSSEDHYVRVVTAAGHELVRYRFADALDEVAGIPGIQVHRSHWVAIGAIARVTSDGKGYRIHLHNGAMLPVSRSNVGVIRAAGLLPR